MMTLTTGMPTMDTMGMRLELHQEACEHCRFCGCTEDTPCAIPMVQDEAGFIRLARRGEVPHADMPCAWFLPQVCNRPECIEKLLEEARGGRIVLTDAPAA